MEGPEGIAKRPKKERARTGLFASTARVLEALKARLRAEAPRKPQAKDSFKWHPLEDAPNPIAKGGASKSGEDD